MEGDRTGTVAEGVVSVVYGSGSRNDHIGSGKSGNRKPDVEIGRGRKGAVNLKCPDAGRRIQHADQDELAAGRRLNDFVVDVDDGAFQNKGDPLFLSQRDGNPRNRFSAGRAESDGKKLRNLSPELQDKTAAAFGNEKLHIFRGVIFGYGAIIMVSGVSLVAGGADRNNARRISVARQRQSDGKGSGMTSLICSKCQTEDERFSFR